jgi:monoamine oxidase
MSANNLLSVTLKAKDTRTKDFVMIHGRRAAELDALPPDILRQRVRDSIDSCIDKTAWDELKRTEQDDREELDKQIEAMR